MATKVQKIAALAVVVAIAAVVYRVASAKVNEDYRNYEILFAKPTGWQELPMNPNTLLLVRDPKTHDLIRCSATQVVFESNPEPDVDTVATVARAVSNAQNNQPEWKTSRLAPFDNGKVEFELFRKQNPGKTIVVAMAVRGNTTLVVSISNTGERARGLAKSYQPLLDFLSSVDLQVTDKWIRLHEKYDRLPE